MEKNYYQRKSKNHPPQEVIDRIRQELSAPDYPYKIIGLPENPTAEEKLKYELCQTIARYKRENKLSEEELENKIGANSQYTHYILYGWIQQLDLRQLLSYLEKIVYPWQIKIVSEKEKNFPVQK